jgi:hypothetical protein
MLIASILILPLVLGAMPVEIKDEGSVVVAELDNPARYTFTFHSGGDDTLELYSLVGVTFSPRGGFDVDGTKTVDVLAFTNRDIRKRDGIFAFEYFLNSRLNGLQSATLQLRVASLADTIEVYPTTLRYLDDELSFTIKNNQNARFEDLSLTFSSPFFTQQKTVDLAPFGTVNVTIPVDSEKRSKLAAGAYVVEVEVAQPQAGKGTVTGTLQYLEQQGTSISETTSGFIIREKHVEKTNAGNVPLTDTITIRKDIISRLFTAADPAPTDVKRSGLSVNYVWEEQLQPGETWSVTTTTNYTLPLLIVLLGMVIAFLVHIYTSTAVLVRKNVSYVKTKGGQFALKVRIVVQAKHHVDSVQVIDRLPGMAKLYEQFGLRPDRLDTVTRRMFWDVGSLQAGEERVFSYILYSDVNPVGRFELPSATAVFEHKGKTHEVLSNRAFFLADTMKGSE